MTPGDKLTVAVPKGKRHPATQTRTTRADRFTAEVVAVDDGGVRIKMANCYPPSGFKVGWEHWRAAWEPFVVEAGT